MVDLAPLTPKDAAAGEALAAAVGWNQDAEDWRRLIDLHPTTVIGAWAEGRLVGTATLAVYGNALAWLGMVISHPEFRGRGIGTAVVDAVLATPEARRAAVIGLDATSAGAPLYRRRGFATVGTVERWVGVVRRPDEGEPLTPAVRVRAAAAVRVRAAGPLDLEAMAAYDGVAAGVDRSRLLAHLVGEPGVRAWLAEGDGGPVGYAILRPGRARAHLGPVAAEDDAVFAALLAAVGESAGVVAGVKVGGSAGPGESAGGAEVFVDAVRHPGAGDPLTRAGLVVTRTLERMTRGRGVASAVRAATAAGAALDGPRLRAATALEWG